MYNDLRLVNTKSRYQGEAVSRSVRFVVVKYLNLVATRPEQDLTIILDYNNNPMIVVHFQSMWVILGRL